MLRDCGRAGRRVSLKLRSADNIRSRQPDRDGRAVARLGADRERTTRLLSKALSHREAETGASTPRLGCEKRLGGVEKRRRIHPRPGIRDPNSNITPCSQAGIPAVLCQRLGRRGKSKVAALGHGIARIRRQAQQDGLELRLVSADRSELRRQFDVKHNVGPQCVVEQLADPVQHCGRIHRLAGERVTPRERQQAAADRAAPLDGSQHNARQPADFVGVRAVPFDQIRLASDGLQDIIDIMGDAAGELAESDHPVGMRRLRLHPVALSNFIFKPALRPENGQRTGRHSSSSSR